VDALRYTLSDSKADLPITPPAGARLLVFTAHRREHLGHTLEGMLRALLRIVKEYPDVYAVCPLHRNPQVQRSAERILGGEERIACIEPPDVSVFHHLLSRSHLILTDSGGIQEEATALGIPTVVMRYSTERTDGIFAGNLRLSGSGEEGIVETARLLLRADSELYESMKKPSHVFGDGNASVRIADALEALLGERAYEKK
jgi:UDP-N-acetylglucosamine 2-epimerase (non-hydrolysing)